MAKILAVATGRDVRAFAVKEGITVGKRGRFNPEVIKAFNDAHKGVARYAEGNEKTVDLKVKVTSKTGKTRTETRPFPMSVVRNALGDGKRGPLSAADKDRAAKALSN